MNSVKTYEPYQGEPSEKRPGLELFWWRSFIFFALFLFATAMFFSMPRHEVSVAHWFVTWVVRFVLLMMFLYHFIIGMSFRKLNYELKENVLIIKSLQHITLQFSEIMEIKEADQSLKLKKIYAYAKESPQVIHHIGQFGKFNISGIGEAFLYATLTSYHHPEGLILIMTKNGKTYGISPERPNEFIEYLQEKLQRFRGQL